MAKKTKGQWFTKNQKASLTVAGVGLGLGAPLWIALTVVLVGVGIGIYLVLTMLPLLVAGVAFFGTFFLIGKFKFLKVDKPWNYIIPFIAAFAAWGVVMIPQVSSAIVNTAITSSGVSAATAAAVEAQFLDVGGLLAAPGMILAIVSIVLAIVVMQSVRAIPFVGNILAGVIGIVIFVTMVLGFSLSGVLPSALAESEGAPPGTVQFTFHVTDAQGNPSRVLIGASEAGVEKWTEGGIAIFYLEPNSAVHISITTPSETINRAYWVGADPETIEIINIPGSPEV